MQTLTMAPLAPNTKTAGTPGGRGSGVVAPDSFRNPITLPWKTMDTWTLPKTKSAAAAAADAS